MTIIVVFNRAFEPATIEAFSEHVRVMLERADPGRLICDVSAQTHPDAVAIEALVRLQLTAHRLGRRFELRGACGALIELLTLMGLCDTLPSETGSGLEPLSEVEDREQVRGIEEERDARDPVT